MGLQWRLLAGLAILVFVAIASTGLLTLRVASGRLDSAEEERARVVGESVAGLLGERDISDAAGHERLERSTRALVGVGGISDVVIIDGAHRVLVGEADSDAATDGALSAALQGGQPLSRRSGGTLSVYAAIREAGPGSTPRAALRLRVKVGDTLGDALRGSTAVLLALTLVDGGLILLFGALFLRSVVRPLEDLSRAARRVAEGDLEVPEVTGGAGELGDLTAAFNRMTAALREQKKNLDASRAQVLAQEKLATVGRLAAGVAHEIGNPLTAILGFVELLLHDQEDPEARDLLTRVRSETNRIHHIVHDLLDYSRPLEGAVEPVAWREVVDGTLALLRPQPRFRDVRVDVELPADLPAVAASSPKLLQVLLNLVLNAADAMGHVGHITITARAAGDRVELDLADSGPGVGPDHRDKIFDPFFSTKEPGAGTGLGLAVCRSIVDTYGGTIALVPSERGATFRVTLPVAPVSAA